MEWMMNKNRTTIWSVLCLLALVMMLGLLPVRSSFAEEIELSSNTAAKKAVIGSEEDPSVDPYQVKKQEEETKVKEQTEDKEKASEENTDTKESSKGKEAEQIAYPEPSMKAQDSILMAAGDSYASATQANDSYTVLPEAQPVAVASSAIQMMPAAQSIVVDTVTAPDADLSVASDLTADISVANDIMTDLSMTNDLTAELPASEDLAAAEELSMAVDAADELVLLASRAAVTGDWSVDLLTLAKTQLGSMAGEQLIILEDGSQLFGTRYGAWAGTPFGDWSAAFVSFCVYYANINVPTGDSCTEYMVRMQAQGLFQAAGNEPRPGDLVFFANEMGEPVRMGIVVSADNGQLRTIEGGHTNRVDYFIYSLDDPSILGYAMLPENPEAPTFVDETALPHELEVPEEDALEVAIEAAANIEVAHVLSEQSLTDDSGRVTVTGLLPEGATITARPLTEAEIQALAMDGVRVVFAYDITIWVNGEEYRPEQPVYAQIAEEGLPEFGLTVSHIDKDENGDTTSTPVDAQVIDGDACFNLGH